MVIMSGRNFFLLAFVKADMEKIKIGKVVNVVGLKGEIKVYNYSDSEQIYEAVSSVYIGNDLREVRGIRSRGNTVMLRLEGICDRDEAEKVRGQYVYISEEELPQLPEGQYYVRDIVGMAVKEEDVLLGTVTDVIQNTAQDILEVEKTGGGKLLIPKVDSFVQEIDAQNREIHVSLIEGMMDL